MKSNLNVKIEFRYHRPWEFIMAMDITANWELFEQLRMDYRLPQNVAVSERIHTFKQHLSKYLLQELKFFFRILQPLDEQVLFQLIYEQPNVETVPELIEHVGNMNEKDFVRILLKKVVDETIREQLQHMLETASLDTGFRSTESEINPISHSDKPDSEVVESILECVKYPLEAKQRFYTLLVGFYQHVYQPVEDELDAYSKIVADKYEQMYQENPDHFCNEILKQSPSSFTKATRIHVSAVFPFGIFISYTESRPDNPHWIVLSTNIDDIVKQREDQERIEKFFKALSDKRRIEIIQRLKERPWYGQELAKSLGLTPAAVNYHMNFLWDLDIVISEKNEHRIYFRLQSEALETLFDLAKQIIVPRT